MIERIRFTWKLLVLASMVVLLGILVINGFHLDLTPLFFLGTVLAVAGINFITYLLMSAGIRKSNREGVVFLLAGIGLKFLLYLFFILLVWILTKNLTKAFILTFFALYLIFTFFTAFHLINLLKNK